MSLYNNVQDSLISRGLIGSLQSGINSAIKNTGAAALAQLGGGKLAQVAVGAATSAASQAAKKVIDKHIPYAMRGKLDAAAGVVGHVMSGDLESAAMSALEGGFLDGAFGGLGSFAQQMNQHGKRTPLLGGVSLATALKMHEEVIRAKHVRKNLFVLEVTSLAEGDMSQLFNLFACDVDYEPFNIASDKQRLGGAVLDMVFGQEPCDLRLTTFDNEAGELKRFFARHHAAAAARDGTVGVPSEYGVRIKVIHGVVSGGNSVASAYSDEGLFRVQTLANSQSRREQALEELQVSFTQLDTFMKP